MAFFIDFPSKSLENTFYHNNNPENRGLEEFFDDVLYLAGEEGSQFVPHLVLQPVRTGQTDNTDFFDDEDEETPY